MIRTFFTNPTFHVFLVPVAFVLIGVYAGKLGRRDGDSSPERNYWAVGTTVLLMALGTVAADAYTYRAGPELLTILGWTVGFLLFLFVSIDHDRYRSWERSSEGDVLERKRLFMGIILPDAISVIVFILYRISMRGAS